MPESSDSRSSSIFFSVSLFPLSKSSTGMPAPFKMDLKFSTPERKILSKVVFPRSSSLLVSVDDDSFSGITNFL